MSRDDARSFQALICTDLPEALPTAFDEKKKKKNLGRPKAHNRLSPGEHNRREKKRREQQRKNFKRLKELLPDTDNTEFETKNSILERAIAFIEELKKYH